MSAAQTIREAGADPGVPLPSVALSNQPAASWHLLAIVLTATFIAYARTLRFDFVYDDFFQLVNNPFVHSWHYLPRYFTSNVWEGVFPGAPGNYYRPIFLLWARINDWLFGGHTSLWHLSTVAAHLLATLLVYFLALRLLRDRLTAGVAALIFGLHPAHLEGVAWVSGVTEPLLGVFFVGSLLGYLKGRESGRRANRWLTWSLFLYAIAILEKETGVVLPALIGVYEWLYGDSCLEGQTWKGRLARAVNAARPTVPFVLITLVYLVARVYALHGFSHSIAGYPVKDVVYTWPILIWFWIRHLIAPTGLGTFYDLRPVEHPGALNFVLPAAGVAICAAALAWGARRSKEVAFAGFWLVLPLIPLLDIRVFARYDFAHDRYLYLPSVGLAIVVAWVIRKVKFGKATLLGYPAFQATITLLLAVALGLGTAFQSSYFVNNRVFYRYNYIMAPNNPYARSNIAAYLGENGNYAESAKLLEAVVKDIPDNWTANYNLGHDYYELNRLPEAVFYLTRATALGPQGGGPFLGLGLAWLRLKDFDRAEVAFRKAIELQPDGYGFHFALGMVLKERGQSAAALEQFKLELAINPDDEAAKRQIAELSERPAATAH